MEFYSFGRWLKQRRKQLRLTQREVAAQAFCSVAMVKKIEADERQPSAELAAALADVLQVPAHQHEHFVQCARGQRPMDTFKLEAVDGTVASHVEEAGLLAKSLPIPVTPFVGRQTELTLLIDRMRQPECRLLTLVAAGGMGKTRLALEVARAVQEDFDDGAHFVNLAVVEQSVSIWPAIAQALQIPLNSHDSPQKQMQRVLGQRQLLLLLDNFEHLVEGADQLSQLLAAAPKVKLLVTSRQRLNLVEEWLFTVSALDETAELFRKTAGRVRPDLENVVDEETIMEICQLVGGHPLAIELAASWTRLMDGDQIAAHIRQDFNFLASGPRNAPARHRSIKALFEHSWRLLSLTEQATLAKLTVFRGGFALAQAAAVCEVPLSVIISLVDKSLVEAQAGDRFDLHELTRQFAGTKLVEMALLPTVQELHFKTYCAVAYEQAPWYTGSRAGTSFQRSEQENDNFRAALAWGLQHGQIETVLELVHNLFVFWLRGGYWQEGERWTETALSQSENQDSVSRCLAMAMLGVLKALQGRFSEAFPLTEGAYRMARRLEEPWPLVVTLQIRGQSARDQDVALEAFAEAIAICRSRLDDPQFSAFLGSLLGLQGDRLMGFGLLTEATASFEASVNHLRSLNDTFWIAYPLGNLGRMALQRGDLEQANELIRESLAITRRSGNRVGIGDWLFRFGQVQLYMGQLAEAERNLRETLRLYEEVGNSFGPSGVLSNIAFVAAEKGEIVAAVSYLHESFRRYLDLRRSARQVDMSADFLEFGDTIDSLLHAGLIAMADDDPITAAVFFSFFEKHVTGYEPIWPLRGRVTATQAAIRAMLSPDVLAEATLKGQSLALEELLGMWKT